MPAEAYVKHDNFASRHELCCTTAAYIKRSLGHCSNHGSNKTVVLQGLVYTLLVYALKGSAGGANDASSALTCNYVTLSHLLSELFCSCLQSKAYIKSDMNLADMGSA